MDKSASLEYFNGASQISPSLCRTEGIRYLSETHFIKPRACLGTGSNNFAEMIALKLIFKIAGEQNVTNLQVMGHSIVVINLIKGI